MSVAETFIVFVEKASQIIESHKDDGAALALALRAHIEAENPGFQAAVKALEAMPAEEQEEVLGAIGERLEAAMELMSEGSAKNLNVPEMLEFGALMDAAVANL